MKFKIKYYSYLIIILQILFVILGNSCSTECNCPDDSDSEIEAQKEVTKAVVHSAAISLGEILNDIPDTNAKINMIRKYIDSVRFYKDSTGYFYVYNFDCVNIAHATQKNLVGQNLYNYQDSKGKYVIRELSAAAKNGGGFVEYYWIKPGETGEKQKIGYVEPIKNTVFFIGSGVYIPE
jgi:signal transduction histidine kinase